MLARQTNRVAPPKNNMLGGDFLTEGSFQIEARGKRVRVIEVLPDQIVTRSLVADAAVESGKVVADTGRDILKIAVIERHSNTRNVGLGLVTGIGLRQGALASSIAHDSHNLVVVGASDAEMLLAAKTVFEMGGGIAAVRGGEVLGKLPLTVAGLMSDRPLPEVRDALQGLLKAARDLGCMLNNPYMQMAFLALPVIPELKVTDKGLVDVVKFEMTDLFC
jgi:adenine deaminase